MSVTVVFGEQWLIGVYWKESVTVSVMDVHVILHHHITHIAHNKWRILVSYFMLIPQQPYWPMEEAP